jgi:hypothetical protein
LPWLPGRLRRLLPAQAAPRGVRVEGISTGAAPAAAADMHGAPRWQYRRLVFEPIPYDAPATACRLALDAALGAAVAVLEESTGRSSQ